MSAFVMLTVRISAQRSLPQGMRLIVGGRVVDDTSIWKRLLHGHACAEPDIVSAQLPASVRQTNGKGGLRTFVVTERLILIHIVSGHPNSRSSLLSVGNCYVCNHHAQLQ